MVSVAGAGLLGARTSALEQATEIEDWHDLDAIREDLEGDYRLVTDLDEDTSGYYEHVGGPDEGWNPIATIDDHDDPGFTGTFDGNGNDIADLEITRPEGSTIACSAETKEKYGK